MPTKLFYEISGVIQITEDNNYYDEDQLLKSLSYDNHSEEIRKELLNRFGKKSSKKKRLTFLESEGESLFEIKNVIIDLDYSKGSVIATGLAIITVAGEISGAIAFIDYLSKAIKFVVEKVIKKNHTNSLPSFSIKFINADEDITDNKEAQDSSLLKKISPVNVLSYLTFINAVLILGGTIFGSFQIKSIQDKFEESSRILTETKLRYYERIDSLQLDVNKTYTDFVVHVNSLNQSIATQDSIGREKILNLRGQLSEISSSVQEMNTSLDDKKNKLQLLQNTLTKTKEENPKFGFGDIFFFMNNGLKFIFILMLLASMLSFVLLFRKRR